MKVVLKGLHLLAFVIGFKMRYNKASVLMKKCLRKMLT
jgi:hypothetical protein